MSYHVHQHPTLSISNGHPAAANAGPALCLLPLAVAPSALGPAAAAACLTGAVASAALCYAGFHPYVLVRNNA